MRADRPKIRRQPPEASDRFRRLSRFRVLFADSRACRNGAAARHMTQWQ